MRYLMRMGKMPALLYWPPPSSGLHLRASACAAAAAKGSSTSSGPASATLACSAYASCSSSVMSSILFPVPVPCWPVPSSVVFSNPDVFVAVSASLCRSASSSCCSSVIFSTADTSSNNDEFSPRSCPCPPPSVTRLPAISATQSACRNSSPTKNSSGKCTASWRFTNFFSWKSALNLFRCSASAFAGNRIFFCAVTSRCPCGCPAAANSRQRSHAYSHCSGSKYAANSCSRRRSVLVEVCSGKCSE
mmetsp:Transcript_28032/g.71048  ORF Transcript_28032/g.71048 Transcript_28032/m.71048 type:complete len:247 (-) Transcript_28032:1928-2668(-)